MIIFSSEPDSTTPYLTGPTRIHRTQLHRLFTVRTRSPARLAGSRNAVANDESSAVNPSSASRTAPLGPVSKRSVPGLGSRLLNCQPLEGQALAELFPERSSKSRWRCAHETVVKGCLVFSEWVTAGAKGRGGFQTRELSECFHTKVQSRRCFHLPPPPEWKTTEREAADLAYLRP